MEAALKTPWALVDWLRANDSLFSSRWNSAKKVDGSEYWSWRLVSLSPRHGAAWCQIWCQSLCIMLNILLKLQYVTTCFVFFFFPFVLPKDFVTTSGQAITDKQGQKQSLQFSRWMQGNLPVSLPRNIVLTVRGITDASGPWNRPTFRYNPWHEGHWYHPSNISSVCW